MKTSIINLKGKDLERSEIFSTEKPVTLRINKSSVSVHTYPDSSVNILIPCDCKVTIEESDIWVDARIYELKDQFINKYEKQVYPKIESVTTA